MSIILNGTTGITTPDVTSDGSLKIDASAPDDSLVVDASGNVGVGTSSPTVYGSYKTLEVRGTGGGLLQFGTGANTAAYIYQDGTNSGFNNIANGVMTFGTNNTERARIDSSGNLLVGKTSTSTSATGVVIAGSGSADHAQIDVARPPNAGMIRIINSSSGSVVGTISQNGTNTTYGTSSDYRLKENIAPMTGALAKVSALKPVTYTWKATGEADEGFIAHELAEVCPSAVTGEKDAVETYTDENGVEQTRPKYQGIDTSFLVATLTAAIQELKAINDAQAQTINAQQTALESLTARVVALEGQP